MPFQTSTNEYQNTKYIVDSSGATPYATIQSAINAANTAAIPAIVYVRPGAYTENLTLYTNISLEGSESTEVTIIGQHTPPNAGSLSFTRIGFISAGANSVLLSAAAGTTNLKFTRCRFVINNGYICNLVNWSGTLTFRYCNEGASANNGVISNATGSSVVVLSNTIIGTGTGNTMTVNGSSDFFNVKLGCPLTISGAGVSLIEGGSILLGMLTTAGTVNLKIRNSTISTGVISAVTVGSAVALLLNNVVIDTSNAIAIAGTGIVNFNEATFVNSKALAGTITEGLVGVVKTGEIYANTVLRMNESGYYSWAAAGPYYDAATLGTFKLLVGGTGYIRGKLVTWVAQNIAGMTSGACWYIYIDATGTIGKTSTRTDLLFVDNIVLFECLYDETTIGGVKLQHVVKENHAYDYPTATSNYEHNVIGMVIENTNNGANIVAGSTGVRISISGDDILADHGLYTTIPTAVDVSFRKFYKNAGGKWAEDTTHSGTDFSGYWNNAGTPTALTAGRYGVYRLYVSKDDLNTTTPTYYAILNAAQFSNAGDAATAISTDTISIADGELMALELAQLGFVTFRQSTGLITVINIQKSTLRSTISAGTGSSTATGVTTNTANFDGILSGTDTQVQHALDTIDDWGKGTTDKCLLVGNGNGNPIGVLAVGTTGTILIGVSANDPTWTTATYPSTVAIGSILHASAANVVSALAVGGTGTILTGVTGGAPAWTTTTYPATNAIGDVLIATAANVVTGVSGAATAGWLLTANGAGTSPTFQAPPGGATWMTKTNATASVSPAAVNTAYTINHATPANLVTITLPATYAVGDRIAIIGNTAGGWSLVAASGDTIKLGNATTTAGGSLTFTNQYDAIEIVCTVADTTWVTASVIGNITYA